MRNRMKKVIAAAIGLGWMALSLGAQAQACSDAQPIEISALNGGRSITFRITLPPSYSTPPATRRYPVIYHLHGNGGAFNDTSNAHIDDTDDHSYSTQMIDGELAEAILVFPDGHSNAQWANKYPGLLTSDKPAERDVIDEILPWIDLHCRTISHKRHRVVQGFSMGGHGAMLYGTKFPAGFATAISFDGAIFQWSEMFQNPCPRGAIATEIFNDDETYFNPYSAYWQATNNLAAIENSPVERMLIVAGLNTTGCEPNLIDENNSFIAHLTSLSLPPTRLDSPTCIHSLNCMLDRHIDDIVPFLNRHLAAPSNVTATAFTSPRRVELTWQDNSTINRNEQSLDVSRRQGTDAWGAPVTVGQNATTFTDTTVAAGTTYTYRVRARYPTSTPHLFTAYSNQPSVSTAP